MTLIFSFESQGAGAGCLPEGTAEFLDCAGMLRLFLLFWRAIKSHSNGGFPTVFNQNTEPAMQACVDRVRVCSACSSAPGWIHGSVGICAAIASGTGNLTPVRAIHKTELMFIGYLMDIDVLWILYITIKLTS